MAELRITTEGDKTEFKKDTKVTLKAESDLPATSYQWFHKQAAISGAVSNQYEFTMSPDTQGQYRVRATVQGRTVDSEQTTIEMSATPPEPAEDEEAAPEAPAVFHSRFAVVIGGLVIAVAIALLWMLPILNGRAGFAAADWTALEARLKFAAVLGLPMILLGGLILLVGLWMAIVEWRGRMVDPPKSDGITTKAVSGEDVAKVIDAVGKLRGAALAMVLGAILLVSAAWIGQSAAAPPDGPAPSASPQG